MKRRITYLLISIFLAAAFSSCSERERNIGIPEGEKATVLLSVKNMDSEVITVTKGMTTPQEQNIESLFILIFNSDGTLVTNQGFVDMTASLTMDTFSGSGMQIYAVANFTSIETELLAVSSLTQLNGIIVNGIGDSAENPGHLTMVGNITMDILPDNANRATINLYYIAAKITVKYVDATPNKDITFFGWEIFDMPVKSYLLGQGTDAVNPANASDFYSITGHNAWEKEEVLNANHIMSESFYMFENRRGKKNGVTQTATAYKDKTSYSVDFPKSTYFKASFNCINRSDGQTYSVVTKIYLGADNYSDFNIQRGKHYTYMVTISGVNSITVNVDSDSNSEAIVFPLTITTSSTLTFDAHPDMRCINIKADNTKISNLSVEVLNNDSWVKISPLNLTLHQISQASASANLYQQPAPSANAEGYYVRPRYIPHKSFREAHPDLSWSEWPAVGTALYDDDQLSFTDATYRMCYKITDLPVSSTDGTTLCIYADEYDYTNGSSTRSSKIRISYSDLQDEGITKYIDYDIVQRQPMSVGLVVDTYDGTFTSYKQAVIEQIEESAIILYPYILTNLQQTRQMQWGYNGSLLYNSNSNVNRFDNFRNGYFLTANAVYGTGTSTWSASGNYVTKNNNGSGVDWSSIPNLYRTKFGSRKFNGNSNSLNESNQNPYKNKNSGAPYYLPNESATKSNNLFYNPIYNTSAARYCHEKNRDLNGDGVISPAETEWYLPSQHELYQVWVSLEAIRYSTTEFGTGYYWSSSESNGSNIYIIGFKTGYADSPRSKTTIDGDGVNDVVRCIRKVDTPSSSSVFLSNSIIDCSDMPSEAITTATKGSAPSGAQGNGNGEELISKNSASVYYKFQVAKADAQVNGPATGSTTMSWSNAIGYSSSYSGPYPADEKLGKTAGNHSKVNPNGNYMRGAEADASTGCRAYWEGSENDPVTGKGHWRLPNKRELYMMWIYKAQLEGQDGFTEFKDNIYWSASERSKNQAHYVNMSNGVGVNPSKGETHYVRCIREL